MGKTTRPTPTAKQIDQERQALELRRAGITYDVIAEKVGYTNRGNAYRAVKRALARTLQEPADELRTLEVDRLDRLQTALWAQAMRGNVGSVDRVLRIQERRARLLGLDRAPVPDTTQQDLATSMLTNLMVALRQTQEATGDVDDDDDAESAPVG